MTARGRRGAAADAAVPGAAAALVARILVPERGVDAAIAVPGGATLALVGANGAGKTTVVEALAGIVAVSGGRIELGGRDLVPVPAWDRGVAIVDQRPVVLGRGRVADEAAFALTVRGMRPAAARAAAAPRLAQVGLADLADRAVSALSGGQIQRLAIARALVADPALLILDEPFASLDAASTEAIVAMLAAERGRRTTILVTHDPIEALRLADAVAVLDAGRIVESGPAAAVLARPATPATVAFAGGAVAPGRVRGGRLEVDAGPLAGASLPMPHGHGLADGDAAVAGLAADAIVVLPAPGR